MLNVTPGCGPEHHTSDLGANFPYMVSIPPREGSDGPEGLCWTVVRFGDVEGRVRDDVTFNWTSAPDAWPDPDGRWISGD